MDEFKPNIKKLREFKDADYTDGKKRISYTQYSQYAACPRQWKLNYIDKVGVKTSNINLVFGTAFHQTLQTYLTVMYSDSVKVADALDIDEILYTNMVTEFTKQKESGFQLAITREEMEEYYTDGLNIFAELMKKRTQFFSSRKVKLIGVEVPIDIVAALNINKNVMMVMYLDIVLWDEKSNSIQIIDLKTSKKGWGDYQKKDKVKSNQVILYKKYYSEHYGVPTENIKAYFFIVKRKIDIDSIYPQRRIQIFEPSNGIVSINKAEREIAKFVSECFTEDGKFNMARSYPAITAPREWNCTFCPFKEFPQYCNPNERKIS